MALLITALLLRGAGLGLVTILAMAAGYKQLECPQIAHASVMLRILTQVGAAFGGAGLAVMLQALVSGSQVGSLANAYEKAFLWLLAMTAVTALPAALLNEVDVEARRVAPQ